MTLVIVNDFKITRDISIPCEADAVTAIDPDAIFSDSISGQSLQTITWRISKLVEAR
jgi:hypothetical protein